MATLFKNTIPLETLFQFPKSFVHRLRDIKIKQLEEQNRRQQDNMNQLNNQPVPSNPLMDTTAFEDFIDELS